MAYDVDDAALSDPRRCRLADAQVRCLLHLVDGTRHEVLVLRVGADFLEVGVPAGGVVLVAYDALVAVQSCDDER